MGSKNAVAQSLQPIDSFAALSSLGYESAKRLSVERRGIPLLHSVRPLLLQHFVGQPTAILSTSLNNRYDLAGDFANSVCAGAACDFVRQ